MKKLTVALFVVIAITFCAFNTFAEDKSDTGPNIILIMADALRYDHLGCYDYFRDTTPNIDKLAANGVIFTRSFAQAPTTMASTVSLLTSRFPRQHQAWNMHGEEGIKGIAEPLLTLPEVLKENGYKTIGIVSNGHLDSDFGFGQGFDEYHETWKLPGADNFLADAKFTTDIIIPWIKENSKQRFFAFLFYIDPHDPYEPPQEFDKYQREYSGKLKGLGSSMHDFLNQVILGRVALDEDDIYYLQALYDGEIAYWDFHIGQLIDTLKELDILKDTIIIVTADHGEEFSDHGGAFHGYAIYNEHLHVPLIMSGDRFPKSKSKVSSVVRNVDLMPTIIDLAKIKKPDGMVGQSLVPLLKSGLSQGGQPVFAEMRLRGAEGKAVELASLQRDNWKIILDLLTGNKELYDLNTDPKEKNNLINSSPDKAKELSERLDKFLNLKPLVNPDGTAKAKKIDKRTIKNLKSLGYIQ